MIDPSLLPPAWDMYMALVRADVLLTALAEENERLAARVKALTEQLDEADVALGAVADHLADSTMPHLRLN